MKFKRRRKNNKQLLLTQAFLMLLLFIGVGYSILNTNLGLNGVVKVCQKPLEPTLYNVIKYEADTNGLAKKYTGSHNDTLNNTGTQDIYHFEGDVREKFNVKLGNMCWQMLEQQIQEE